MNGMQIFAARCGDIETVILPCSDGISSVFVLIIDVLSVLVGILMVIGIVVVGIQWITAGDNVNQVMKAKRRMLEIVIGAGVWVLLYAGLAFLLPGGVANPGDIYNGTEMQGTTDNVPSWGGNNAGSNAGGDAVSFTPNSTIGNTGLTNVTPMPLSDDAVNVAESNGYLYYCKTNKNAVEFEQDRVTPTGNVSAGNCLQKVGERMFFNLDEWGVLLNHPIKSVSSSSVVTSPSGHHGFWHEAKKANSVAAYWMFQGNVVTGYATPLTIPVDPINDSNNTFVTTYYGGDALAVPQSVVLCDEVASQLDPNNTEQWCYDSRSSGQEVADMDIHHSLGISDFYKRDAVKNALSAAVGSVYSTTKYQQLDSAGVPVFSIFVPNGGSVSFGALSRYQSSDANCATVDFKVTSLSNKMASGYYAHMSTIGGTSGVPGVNTIVAYTGNEVCADGTNPHVHVTLHGYNLQKLVQGGKIAGANLGYASSALDVNSGTISDVLAKHFQVICNMNTICAKALKEEYIKMKTPQQPTVPTYTDYAPRKAICQKFTANVLPGIVTAQNQQLMQGYLRCGTDVVTQTELYNKRGLICGILNGKVNNVTLINRVRSSVGGNAVYGELNTMYYDLGCAELMQAEPAKPTRDEYINTKCPKPNPLSTTANREWQECKSQAGKEWDNKYGK